MENNTQTLTDLTKKMKDMTEQLKNDSENAYKDLRKGGAATSRRDALRSMEAASSIEAKAVFAAHYFKSFEFQLWKNNEYDTVEIRAHLMKEAVEEFLATFKDYGDIAGTVSQKPESTALALMLHKTEAGQRNAVENGIYMSENLKVESMQTLLVKALLKKEEIQDGKIDIAKVPGYVAAALKKEKTAKKVLKLRAEVSLILYLRDLARYADATTGVRWFEIPEFEIVKLGDSLRHYVGLVKVSSKIADGPLAAENLLTQSTLLSKSIMGIDLRMGPQKAVVDGRTRSDTVDAVKDLLSAAEKVDDDSQVLKSKAGDSHRPSVAKIKALVRLRHIISDFIK